MLPGHGKTVVPELASHPLVRKVDITVRKLTCSLFIRVLMASRPEQEPVVLLASSLAGTWLTTQQN